METIKLSNGIEMPVLGYGVYQIAPEDCERCVLDAISTGYRSIDTAQAYYNEEQVGSAIIKSGISREEFFITTKVWISNAGEAKAKASIEESLRKLKMDYIDLLLIHQPYGDYYGTYRAMQEAYREGKLRAIGLSNFYPSRFIDLAEHMEIKPMVCQLETHVFCQQWDTRKIMDEYGTHLMAWAPLGEGYNNFFQNEILKAIGDKYGKTVAQVALQYLISQGIIVIPKSQHKERMAENIQVLDFFLTDKEIETIKKMDERHPVIADFNAPDPTLTKFLLSYKV